MIAGPVTVTVEAVIVAGVAAVTVTNNVDGDPAVTIVRVVTTLTTEAGPAIVVVTAGTGNLDEQKLCASGNPDTAAATSPTAPLQLAAETRRIAKMARLPKSKKQAFECILKRVRK